MGITHVAPHGSASRYSNGGCRCGSCRTAWAEYYRARARANGRRARGRAATAARRLGLARRDGESVADYALRMSNTRAWLRQDEYYPDKAFEIRVRLTDLSCRLLEAEQARAGRDYDDLIEHMTRMCAGRIQFEETVST